MQSIYLSINLSIYLSIWLSVCPSVRLSVCPSVRPFVCLYIHIVVIYIENILHIFAWYLGFHRGMRIVRGGLQDPPMLQFSLKMKSRHQPFGWWLEILALFHLALSEHRIPQNPMVDDNFPFRRSRTSVWENTPFSDTHTHTSTQEDSYSMF